MSDIYVTLYTKEHGRLEFTRKDWLSFDGRAVTLHKEDGPAWIYYYNNGSIRNEYYYINNQYHRIDGPAAIYYNENGTLAIEYYFINDQSHRIDGPADVYYHVDGTVISEHYYINNQYHRIDGPAVIYYYNDGTVSSESYYLNDKEYSKEDYWKEIKILNNKSNTLKMVE